jgi:hypothetical protein
MAIWYILWSFWYIFPFWYVEQRKMATLASGGKAYAIRISRELESRRHGVHT